MYFKKTFKKGLFSIFSKLKYRILLKFIIRVERWFIDVYIKNSFIILAVHKAVYFMKFNIFFYDDMGFDGISWSLSYLKYIYGLIIILSIFSGL